MTETLQFKPNVVAIETPLATDCTTEVRTIVYSSEGLKITVASAIGSALVQFPSSLGFRVLDEGDLTEFWSQCSLKTGWLFEVVEGGWTDLERTRAHFVSGMLNGIREFIVVGFNDCVSIISKEGPQVHVERAA